MFKHWSEITIGQKVIVTDHNDKYFGCVATVVSSYETGGYNCEIDEVWLHFDDPEIEDNWYTLDEISAI